MCGQGYTRTQTHVWKQLLTKLVLMSVSSQINELAASPGGMRFDSGVAYLLPALNGACKANLRLVQGVTASKLVFEGNRAVAVETLTSMGAAPVTWRARREIVLASGPYGSAKLLQLSGIGPEAVLAEHGIEQVQHSE